MFEIYSKNKDYGKLRAISIVSTIIMEIILYAIMSFFEAPLKVFCTISGVVSFILFLGIIILTSHKFVIDEDEEIVKFCIEDTCKNTIKMKDIKKVTYEVNRKGIKSVNIMVKNDPDEMKSIFISTYDFSDKDIRSAFERLSSLSEKYGFKVEERYESEASSLAPSTESSIPSDMGTIEISEDEILSSEDLTPYRVK
jgi:hypothetical protein